MNYSIPMLLSILIFASCSSSEPDRNLTTPAPPKSIVEGQEGKRIDSLLTPFITQILKDHDCPSALAIGVTKGDQIIYARAFGLSDIRTGRDCDLQTRFQIASISKPFVATAIAKLIELKKVDPDSTVTTYLPYFKLASDEYREIKIKHLLTHTSGLPKHLGPDNWTEPRYDDAALEDYVKEAAKLTLEFSPGTDFNYSDVGFNILGDVISKTSGKSFEQFMQEDIFSKVGMDHSSFFPPDTTDAAYAAPHIIGTSTQVWKHYPYNRQYAPCTCMNTNVLDLCTFAMMHLNEGTINGDTLMTAESYGLLTLPWAETPWGDYIGMSWFLQSYLESPTIMHTGESIGFSAQLITYPEENIGIVVLANRAYSRTARIANAAFEVIKGEPIKDYSISARFPFSQTWEMAGIDSAGAQWRILLADTTDNYYANEWELNLIGHGLIFTEEYEKALEAFQLNIEINPNSPNVYDSYGDALLAKGDTSVAIEYFLKALEVDPEFPDPGPKLKALGFSGS